MRVISWCPPVLVLSQLQQMENSSIPSLSEVAMALLTEIFHKWTPPVSYTDNMISKPCTVFDTTCNQCHLSRCEAALAQVLLCGWSLPMIVM